MESIGRLAGGVAHDFNNMLQAILGNAALALEDGSGSREIHEHLREIQKAAMRSGDLTRQLLTFARKQTTVETAPGQGTTLTLHLPRAHGVGVAEVVRPVERPVQGTETVLLVEDEDQVLTLLGSVLRRHGYTVLGASLPDVALTLAAQHDGPIHLLLTDVVMPGMNGRDLLSRVAALKPGVRCLFVSGYTADVIAHQGVLEAGVQFLQKPFGIPALTQKVREALDGAPVGA